MQTVAIIGHAQLHIHLLWLIVGTVTVITLMYEHVIFWRLPMDCLIAARDPVYVVDRCRAVFLPLRHPSSSSLRVLWGKQYQGCEVVNQLSA